MSSIANGALAYKSSTVVVVVITCIHDVEDCAFTLVVNDAANNNIKVNFLMILKVKVNKTYINLPRHYGREGVFLKKD